LGIKTPLPLHGISPKGAKKLWYLPELHKNSGIFSPLGEYKGVIITEMQCLLKNKKKVSLVGKKSFRVSSCALQKVINKKRKKWSKVE
jgi:hypothetical protein